jgi:uncharacterized membrane protein YjgN (DUF898 family)
MADEDSNAVGDSAAQPLNSTRSFVFHGSGGELFKITIVNLLLTIVTLGVYYFWGRTRVRQYIYSQTEFDGDRFAYHGTGKELLIGWLKGMGFLVISIAFFGVLGWILAGPANPAFVLFIYLPILIFVPLVMVGSLRYRFSRTSWRGIRFSFRGKLAGFYLLFLKGLALTLVTIGFYLPYFSTHIRKFIVESTRFGTHELRFDGDGRDLFKSYVKMFLLILPTLSLYLFWYQAYVHRYFWEKTSLGSARMRSTVTGGGLLKLQIVNGLIVLFTLGIGTPWATVRSVRYLMDHITMEGEVDFASIAQDYQEADATAEEVGDILELDMIDLGLGI